MLTKRIIPCLDIDRGRTVKGLRFASLKDAGDPVALAQRYESEGADELVFLDITATLEHRSALLQLVEQVSAALSIPFTVGGGVQGPAQVEALLRAGADKISLNSAAVQRPELIDELAANFGSQCIVLAVDADKRGAHWEVMTHGGRNGSGLEVIQWCREGEQRGAGEILLTAMPCDGTRQGYALELTAKVAAECRLPLIASGGAGSPWHFQQVLTEGGADAALAASLFHYGHLRIPELKSYLKTQNILIR